MAKIFRIIFSSLTFILKCIICFCLLHVGDLLLKFHFILKALRPLFFRNSLIETVPLIVVPSILGLYLLIALMMKTKTKYLLLTMLLLTLGIYTNSYYEFDKWLQTPQVALSGKELCPPASYAGITYLLRDLFHIPSEAQAEITDEHCAILKLAINPRSGSLQPWNDFKSDFYGRTYTGKHYAQNIIFPIAFFMAEMRKLSSNQGIENAAAQPFSLPTPDELAGIFQYHTSRVHLAHQNMNLISQIFVTFYKYCDDFFVEKIIAALKQSNLQSASSSDISNDPSAPQIQQNVQALSNANQNIRQWIDAQSRTKD